MGKPFLVICAEELEELSGTLLEVYVFVKVILKKLLALLGNLFVQFSMTGHADGVFKDGFCLLKGFLDQVIRTGFKEIPVTGITFAKGFPMLERPEVFRDGTKEITFVVQGIPVK